MLLFLALSLGLAQESITDQIRARLDRAMREATAHGLDPEDYHLEGAVDLPESVKRFQHRHGRNVDGVVGERTLEATNVPPAERVAGAADRARLDRWRGLPEESGPRYVLVNVPSFGLQLFEQGRRALEMRVVVGRPYFPSP